MYQRNVISWEIEEEAWREMTGEDGREKTYRFDL